MTVRGPETNGHGIRVEERNADAQPAFALHPAFDWRRAARLMLLSRAFDELEERELTPSGKVKYQFSARGHELGQSLLSQLIQPGDGVAVYYRNRPLLLGLGLTLHESLCGGMANAGSLSGGRDVGITSNLGRRNGVTFVPIAAEIGSQYSPSAGFAQALRYRHDVLGEEHAGNAIVICYGGDGSVSSNGFWAGLNMATAHNLPVLFVIEDNGYAISVRHDVQQAGGDIAKNLGSFTNLKIFAGSGTRPVETATLIDAAIQFVRGKRTPALLRLTVPRLSGHSSVDTQTYKTQQEIDGEWANDPVAHMRAALVPAVFSESEWNAMQHAVTEEVSAAAKQAGQEPLPDAAEIERFAFSDPHVAQLVGGLRAEGIALPATTSQPEPPDNRRLNMIDAIRRTLDVELAANPRMVVFGEDVGAKGGVHAATLGLQARHGERRVFDTSLSEEGIMGRAAGMAAAGLLPVPEIQFRKYADPCREHLINIGNLRWRTAGRMAAPMVVRMPGGFRKLGDPWHSVTNEVEYVHAVGWRVAVPSNAEDAVGLLRTALCGDDPVIFFEHRYCYDAQWSRRPYPGDAYALPFGKAAMLQRGSSATVVTWGAMVEVSEQAIQQAQAEVDLIDLRTLSPWDASTVIESVRKTGRCLIVHEDTMLGGFGAEIAAVVGREAFFDLDAPVERVAAPQTMVPFSQHLMAAVVPTAARVQQALTRLIRL